ncbi:MHYT domain-containing protein [Saccharothrix australiensis]|uniref:MHYT domain-containing protein n=1 Tax=Saccharothrix australiensis TaxID=2072 RepID=UPI000EAF90E9|nr:MHYT domain-containing protein [Saccharothrix australiensis]
MNHETTQHFSSGPWTLLLAYGVSVIGSLIGLACVVRARREPGRGARVRWTALGALAVGGIGIWLMHFIAMLGFDVPAATIRYSGPVTALSALVAVVAVGFGLSLVTLARFTGARLVLAGLPAGLGVAGMHYLGMAAIRFKGEVFHDELLVAASVVIALVATTAALWFALVVRTVAAQVVGGLVLGAAVTGMHYTGMAAIRATSDPKLPAPQGIAAFDLVFPVFVISGLVVGVLLWTLFTASGDASDDFADRRV